MDRISYILQEEQRTPKTTFVRSRVFGYLILETCSAFQLCPAHGNVQLPSDAHRIPKSILECPHCRYWMAPQGRIFFKDWVDLYFSPKGLPWQKMPVRLVCFPQAIFEDKRLRPFPDSSFYDSFPYFSFGLTTFHKMGYRPECWVISPPLVPRYYLEID